MELLVNLEIKFSYNNHTANTQIFLFGLFIVIGKLHNQHLLSTQIKMQGLNKIFRYSEDIKYLINRAAPNDVNRLHFVCELSALRY